MECEESSSDDCCIINEKKSWRREALETPSVPENVEIGKEDVYDEFDVINIEDDDDEECRVRDRDPSKKMVCWRCPSAKEGTFKCKDLYFFHIKRHIVPGQFSCPTCKRPFVKLVYCISHEIRVHGTDIQYCSRSPVVAFARKYMEEKRAKEKEKEPEKVQVIDICDSSDDDDDQAAAWTRASKSPNLHGPPTDEDYETDPEDVKFYENYVVCSNALVCYKGPPVNNRIEQYEIQLYHSRNPSGMDIAQTAIKQHKLNVKLGRDTFKLGRFSGNREKPLKPLVCLSPPKPDETKLTTTEAQRHSKDKDASSKPPSKKRKVREFEEDEEAISESHDMDASVD